jgi:hypothetical protein
MIMIINKAVNINNDKSGKITFIPINVDENNDKMIENIKKRNFLNDYLL